MSCVITVAVACPAMRPSSLCARYWSRPSQARPSQKSAGPFAPWGKTARPAGRSATTWPSVVAFQARRAARRPGRLGTPCWWPRRATIPCPTLRTDTSKRPAAAADQ